MPGKISILFLIILLVGLFFPALILAGEYQYDSTTVHYEGLVPCGKATSSLPAVYDEKGNLIKKEESPEVAYPCQFCHLFVMLDGIITFVLFDILPLVAILMIVIGGVMFFAAVGDPAKINRAKSLLTAVAIGLVIIYSSYLIIGAVLTATGVLEWTTLDKWSSQGSFIVYCPIGEDGVSTSPTTPTVPTTPEEWDVQKPVQGEYPKCEKEDTAECGEGQKAENGKCEPGANTNVTTSKKTDDGKGWYCKFTADFKPALGYLECYVPTGTIYVNCIDDPDYVPSPAGEWISTSTDTSAANIKKLTLNCPEGTKLEGEGICQALGQTDIKEDEPYGDNGWYCEFKGRKGGSATGKLSIFCVSE